MLFNGRDQRFEVTYELLSNFARRMNMPFDTGANQINIIELRGAKPVYSGLAISTQDQLEPMIMDYDALHDYKTQVPGLFDTTWTLITEILKKDPSLYRELVPHGQNSYLDFISTGCRNIVNSSNAIVQQFRQRARDIETEVDRLDLAGKRRRVETSGIEDNRCWLELADNVVDRMTDTIILVWQDSLGNPHIRPLLGSINPGINAIQEKWAACIGSGNYYATWGGHGPNYPPYPCLNINGGEAVRGTRITDFGRLNNNSLITQYTFFNESDPNAPSQIQIHAGPKPQNPISTWSRGCALIAGSQVASNPSTIYDEIFGGDTLTGSSWLRIDPPEPITNQPRFNVIVWDAWSLYRLHLESIGLIAFKPILQIGAADVRVELRPGENGEQWVDRMQQALNARIRILQPYKDSIERTFNTFRNQLYNNQQRDQQDEQARARINEWRLFIPQNMVLPEMNEIPLDGENGEAMIFGNATAAALRTFQLACYVLLENADLEIGTNINRNELIWERNQWVCGPVTWELLESRTFNVLIAPRPAEQRFPQWPWFAPDPGNPLRPPWQEPERE